MLGCAFNCITYKEATQATLLGLSYQHFSPVHMPPNLATLPPTVHYVEPEAVVRERLAQANVCLYAPDRAAGNGPDRDEQFAAAAFDIADGRALLVVACLYADKVVALADPPTRGIARGGSAETLQYACARNKQLIVIELDAPTGPAGALRTIAIPAHL